MAKRSIFAKPRFAVVQSRRVSVHDCGPQMLAGRFKRNEMYVIGTLELQLVMILQLLWFLITSKCVEKTCSKAVAWFS
jgi:hypothetical protein